MQEECTTALGELVLVYETCWKMAYVGRVVNSLLGPHCRRKLRALHWFVRLITVCSVPRQHV